MAGETKIKRVRRYDNIPREEIEITPEGFLIDTPIVTCIGIFEYNLPDGSVHRELRLPEHVFAEESLATYEGKPVIITHDAGRITKENVDKENVGTILSKGWQDGDNVRAKVVIHDTDKVKQSGMRELSLGYDLVLDETPGEWNGQPYDAIQTEIVINHLAIVSEARAGEQARLNIDSANATNNNLQEGAEPMATNKGNKSRRSSLPKDVKKSIAAYDERRKRRLDEAEENQQDSDTENPTDVSDEESEVAEEIKESEETPSIEERIGIIKDRRDRRDADGDPEDPEAAMGVIAQQDEDIGQLLEIVEELQAAADIANSDSDCENSDEDDTETNSDEDDEGGGEKPFSADSVDAIVSERLKLARLGDRLNLDGLETVSPVEAKKRIIRAIKPNLRLDGKGKHYINTAFDIAVQELNSRKDTNYQRRQMFNGDGYAENMTGKSKAQTARENMINRMKNGGK